MEHPSTAAGDDGLSAYERQRLAKIARNNARLTSLGLGPGGPIATRIAGGQNSKTPNAKHKSRRSHVIAEGTRRSSHRLKNVKARAKEVAGDPLVDVATEKAKRWMVEHSFDGVRRVHSDARDSPFHSSPAKKRTQKSSPKTKTVSAVAKDGVIRSPPAKKRLPKPSQGTKEVSLAAISMDDLREYEKDAFLALREWKRARAKELGYTDPCVICHNRTLVEMCRRVPKDEKALLGIWGIGANRLRQHGALMLAALAPWRERLAAGHAKCGPRGTPAGGALPAQDWLNQAAKLGLPTGPWDERRAWCARHNQCSACQRHGPDAPWAACTQRLLNILQDRHGGRDAGWRWHARPAGSAHLHQWWPPQSICDEEQLSARNLPLGTMAVLDLLYKRNRNKRTRKG